MTNNPLERADAGGRVPTWNLADRLNKALRESDLSIPEIAVRMGVSRDTISRWINGRNAPSKAAQMVFASLTGVSQEWLETGEASARSEGFEPPTFWFGVSRLQLVWSVRESLTPELPLGLVRPRVLRAVA